MALQSCDKRLQPARFYHRVRIQKCEISPVGVISAQIVASCKAQVIGAIYKMYLRVELRQPSGAAVAGGVVHHNYLVLCTQAWLQRGEAALQVLTAVITDDNYAGAQITVPRGWPARCPAACRGAGRARSEERRVGKEG